MWKLRAVSDDAIYIQTETSALVVKAMEHTNPREWRRIARLIEAAPEMLEILEALQPHGRRIGELVHRVSEAERPEGRPGATTG